jgi:hypothetical protein
VTNQRTPVQQPHLEVSKRKDLWCAPALFRYRHQQFGVSGFPQPMIAAIRKYVICDPTFAAMTIRRLFGQRALRLVHQPPVAAGLVPQHRST